MKYQLTSRNPETAASDARARHRRRRRWRRRGRGTAAGPSRAGGRRGAARARASAAAARPRRAPHPSDLAADGQQRSAGSDAGAATRRRRAVEMTWTSMAPESRITRSMTDPPTISARRDRRLAPSTIWVAFSARATSSRARATSVPMTSTYRPPSSSTSSRCRSSSSVDGPRTPSSRWTWTARSSAFDRSGQPGGPAHELVAAGSTGQGDDDALAGLPRALDAVPVAVVVELVVDAIGDPEQRQLAEGAQVPDPEVVGQRGVDALGRVDVAVRHAPAQRLGRHVDQLDLVGGAHPRVRNRLALGDAR